MNFNGRVILVLVVLGLCLGVDAMPMHILTPEEQAHLLMMPTRSEIANLRADLVAGDITNEQYLTALKSIEFRLEIQSVLLIAIRDSDKSFNEKVDMLLAIFPWNVR